MEFIRLQSDLFDDEKIKIILAQKNGSEIALTWVRLLCLSGQKDSMGLFQISGKPMTAAMLSTVTRTPKKLMVDALSVFSDLGMIEQVDGFYLIPNWEKYQKVDADEERRRKDRERKQNSRKKALASLERHRNVRGMSQECPRNVTGMSQEIPQVEKDKDIDINTPPIIPPAENSADGDESACVSFKAFWNAYPKREGRESALNAWRKLNPGTDLIHTIIAAIDRDKQTDTWLRENGRYIPMPVRYIKERRWEDQHMAEDEKGDKTYNLDDAFKAAVLRQRQGVMA